MGTTMGQLVAAQIPIIKAMVTVTMETTMPVVILMVAIVVKIPNISTVPNVLAGRVDALPLIIEAMDIVTMVITTLDAILTEGIAAEIPNISTVPNVLVKST